MRPWHQGVVHLGASQAPWALPAASGPFALRQASREHHFLFSFCRQGPGPAQTRAPSARRVSQLWLALTRARPASRAQVDPEFTRALQCVVGWLQAWALSPRSTEGHPSLLDDADSSDSSDGLNPHKKKKKVHLAKVEINAILDVVQEALQGDNPP